MQFLCDQHGINASKIDPAVGSSTSTVMEQDFSLVELKLAALLMKEAEGCAPIRIQTMTMLPETNSKGQPFILDGSAMKRNGFMGVWGDWLMHPKTLERLKEKTEHGL